MQCEICGKNSGKGTRIETEGTEMIACEDCARFGKAIEQPQAAAKQAIALGKKISFGKNEAFEELVLFDDFVQRIKRAREKKQLLFEDLSKQVGEKASVLKHIESGQIKPTNELVKRLEKTLEIRLVETD